MRRCCRFHRSRHHQNEWDSPLRRTDEFERQQRRHPAVQQILKYLRWRTKVDRSAGLARCCLDARHASAIRALESNQVSRAIDNRDAKP